MPLLLQQTQDLTIGDGGRYLVIGYIVDFDSVKMAVAEDGLVSA